MTASGRRAVIIEYTVPSREPAYIPPDPPPWYEKILPYTVRQRRERLRRSDAIHAWRQRVAAWNEAGRPPDTRRIYSPSADIRQTADSVEVIMYPADFKEPLS